MQSLWWDGAHMPSFSPLSGDRSVDTLIVGGGMAGLLTAYMLRRAGADFMLIDSGRLMGGVSGSTTGKITALHGAVFAGLIRRFGTARTRAYYEANTAAIGEYRSVCDAVGCGIEDRAAYVYSRDNAEKIKKEYTALRRIGAQAELSGCPGLPFGVAAAVKLGEQAQFDPLEFAAAVVSTLPADRIHEHTAAREFAGCDVLTDCGKIHARRVVIATHFPVINSHGFYYLKMYQHRSYVLALSGAPRIDGMYVDEKSGGLSFRDAGGYLLIGGCGKRTGKKCGGWSELGEFAKKHYPNASVAFRWATQDCMTLDGIPYIGRYSSGRGADGLYVATGFNKWGMSGSMVAAMLLSDIILGKENRFESVFSPFGADGASRTPLRPQLLSNAGHALAGWITPTVPRCPHLGCALRWNAAEHSWDCPCHGSRFGENGELLDDPATARLK